MSVLKLEKFSVYGNFGLLNNCISHKLNNPINVVKLVAYRKDKHISNAPSYVAPYIYVKLSDKIHYFVMDYLFFDDEYYLFDRNVSVSPAELEYIYYSNDTKYRNMKNELNPLPKLFHYCSILPYKEYEVSPHPNEVKELVKDENARVYQYCTYSKEPVGLELNYFFDDPITYDGTQVLIFMIK
jgi:hypothetical protein